MPIQPLQPRRGDSLGKVATVGGGIAGGIATGGSPGGISLGAGLGRTASGLTQQPQVQSVETQGMSRRRASLAQDPLQTLRQAQAALQTLPPNQLPETRQALQNALAIAQRNQQLGRGGA